ncbi:saccharopine dehydrogenase NADP-binding domain-containing protein [Bradyrhizobium manausense]|uniref:saccharopine dehydrogenase family protein n=1 Tax=Bradyrhizobium manausense TaxID=989370 RepID=UPI001BA718F2|nr:DUF5938 domain-containing protein [Bradyrhizobium manausense]MBR0834227.1 saccharopine dehydrogenase NADP-binding domain-containing protein [Bradyrhizobium manausense]
MSMSTSFPVVVYGASGYTGRMVMEHLRDVGVPFIAAGRDRARIEAALKLVPGIENAEYEIRAVEHNVDALARLLEGCKVICNTVGPFMRYSRPVVEACLKAGVHYLDTTGEQHVVSMLMDEYGTAFAKAGLCLIPSTACMYGLSEIGARYCLETPGVDSLEMTEIAQAVPTVASAQTILDAVRHPAYFLKNNELVRYPGIETSDITTPSGRVLRASNWGGTSNPIWFSRDGRVRNCRMSVAMWNQELYKKELELERAYKVQLQWIPEEALYPLLDRMATAITPGTPPRESRFVHRAIDVCVATGNTVMVRSTLMATGGYFTTGLLQAYAARRLVTETPRVTGFRSPSEVFGHRELMGALESYGYAAIKVERLV